MRDFLPSSSLIACNQLGTVYLYEESEHTYSKTILNLKIAYYIIADYTVCIIQSIVANFFLEHYGQCCHLFLHGK